MAPHHHDPNRRAKKLFDDAVGPEPTTINVARMELDDGTGITVGEFTAAMVLAFIVGFVSAATVIGRLVK